MVHAENIVQAKADTRRDELKDHYGSRTKVVTLQQQLVPRQSAQRSPDTQERQGICTTPSSAAQHTMATK